MSHITRIVKTQIRDLDALLKALHDVGYKNVQVHDTPQPVYEWLYGPRRAEVVIRRRRFGIFSDDIGFTRSNEGTLDLICRRKEEKQLLRPLMQRYIYHVARAKLEAQGFTLVADEVQENDRIHLVLRRTT